MHQLADTLLFLAPFIIMAALGRYVVAWCVKRGLFAGADDRRAHASTTPHGGGILMVLVGVPLALAAVHFFDLPYPLFLNTLFIASVPVALVGLWDDMHEVPPFLRLLVHLPMVAVGLVFLPQMFDMVPLWMDRLFFLLAWGWFVNLFNFMDGADGYASSQATFLFLALGVLVAPFKPLAIVLAGTSMGFLTINWQPAKVYLGDVGSTWLGYVLGGLLLVACADDTWTIAWPLFITTLVFTADATWTLLRRTLSGHAPWVPHNEFWFHRVLRLGYSHSQLVARAMGVNMLLLLIAIFTLAMGAPSFALPLGVALIVYTGYKVRQMEGSFHVR